MRQILKSKKYLPLFFCCIFLLTLLGGLGLLLSPVHAAELKPPSFAVDIGSTHLNFQSITCGAGQECKVSWLGDYIKALYNYGIALAGALAVIMIMVGGFFWLTSAGSPQRVGTAKEFITSAILGLLLALFSYTILNTINPRLTALEPLVIQVPNDVAQQAASIAQANRAQQQNPQSAGCPTAQEMANGFTAHTTAYSKPTPANFSDSGSFLCAVALNCTCPNNNAHDTSRTCSGGGMTWTPCANFDAANTNYCNHTSAPGGPAPTPGTIAADPNCFKYGDQLCIDGQTYTVQDSGGAIRGHRFDIWMNDYSAAAHYNNPSSQVTAGACQ